MPTTLNSVLQYTHSFSEKGISPLKKFLAWSKAQKHNHFMWIGIGIALQGCALAPITSFFVSLVGMNLLLFCIVLTAMAMVVVTCLAGFPPKVTIPVLAASVIIDLGVIVTVLAMLM
jgi:hypothetical protein